MSKKKQIARKLSKEELSKAKGGGIIQITQHYLNKFHIKAPWQW